VELQNKRQDESRLRGQLEELSKRDLHDQLQDCEIEYTETAAECERFKKRAIPLARAYRLLHGTYSASQERLMEPLRERIDEAIKTVFPRSHIDLADDGKVLGLRSGTTPEPWDHLSAGTREQINVIVRAETAELLADGKRLPLILDEAMVNTDPERRESMMRYLHKKSEALQVIVFTCRPGEYDNIGAGKVINLPRSPHRVH
jgi:hypothetical protein